MIPRTMEMVRADSPTFPRLRALMLRLWSNSWLWSAAAQALGSGMSLIVSVVAARLLGVAGFGTYVLVHAGVVLLATIQYQLVAGPMAVTAGHRARSPAYFQAVAQTTLWVAAAIGIVVALYCAAVVGSSGIALPVSAALFAVGFVVHDTAKRLAFATERPRTAFACEAARHLLFVLSLTGAWFARGADAATLLACGGLSAVLAALPVYRGAIRGRLRTGLHRTVLNHHWRLGRWLVLMVFVSAAHEQVATILVGSWLGKDAAGGLRAAQILLGPLLVLLMSLENTVPRRAAQNLRAGGTAALHRYLLRVIVILEAAVIPVCLLLAYSSATLLSLLLGQDFTAFAPVAAIIMMSPPLTLLREFGIIYLRTRERTEGIFAAFVGSAVVTLLSIYPLIGSYGVVGAAWTIILGHAVSTALVLAFVGRVMLQPRA